MERLAIRRGSGFRFSLRALLLLVVAVSIGAAALRSSTIAWAAAAVTGTQLALFAAIVAALFDIRRRPIWLGYAVGSGGYLMILLGAPVGIIERLPTEYVNRLLLKASWPKSFYPSDDHRPFVTSHWKRHEQAHRAEVVRSLRPPTFPSFLLLLDVFSANANSLLEGDIEADTSQPTATPPMDSTLSGNSGPTNDAASNPDGQATTSEEPTEEEKLAQIALNFQPIARCCWAWCCGAWGAGLARILTARNPGSIHNRLGANNVFFAATAKTHRTSRRAAWLAFLSGAFAIGCSGLYQCNDSWMSALLTFAALAAPALAIGAVFGNPRRRAFRSGFTIFCGGYFLLFAYVDVGQSDGPAITFLNSAATSTTIFYLHDRRFPEDAKDDPMFPGGGSLFVPSGGMPAVGSDGPGLKPAGDSIPVTPRPEHIAVARVATQLWQMADAKAPSEPIDEQSSFDRAFDFVVIGQSLCALLLGCLGGTFAELIIWQQSKKAGPLRVAVTTPNVAAAAGSI